MSWNHENDDPWVTGGSTATNNFDNNKSNGADSYGGGDARLHEKSGNEDANGGGSDGCRNCGQEGHFARECPEPRKNTGACFNCGEEGHSKADCPNPRVFKGTCRICEKEGHPAAECPDKPPEICRNCKKEGHKVGECKENRVIDVSDVPTKTPDEAWEDLVKADQARDMDDIRDALKVYVKAVPDTDWQQLERSFRTNKFNTYIIAYEKDVTDTFTLMNLQGKLDCKYHVGYFFTPYATRGNMRESWPKTAEENMERLKDCGVPVDRGIPKCGNCDQLGHIAKSCPEEKVERTDRVQVMCVNCEEPGHRARDCLKERKDRFACRNCKQSGHKAEECTEPRSAEGIECKHCNEMGHFAKDCPEKAKETCRNCGEEGHRSKECEAPRNPATIQCRNCDEMGHMSKECTKKRDYSRVECQNCGEKGHTKVRCKQAPKDDPPAADTVDYGDNVVVSAAVTTTAADDGGW